MTVGLLSIQEPLSTWNVFGSGDLALRNGKFLISTGTYFFGLFGVNFTLMRLVRK